MIVLCGMNRAYVIVLSWTCLLRWPLLFFLLRKKYIFFYIYSFDLVCFLAIVFFIFFYFCRAVVIPSYHRAIRGREGSYRVRPRLLWLVFSLTIWVQHSLDLAEILSDCPYIPYTLWRFLSRKKNCKVSLTQVRTRNFRRLGRWCYHVSHRGAVLCLSIFE